MSTTYSVKAVLGVAFPYTEVTDAGSTPGCRHNEPGKWKHCPECGAVREKKQTVLRPEWTKMLDTEPEGLDELSDDTSLVYSRVPGVVSTLPIRLHLRDPAGESPKEGLVVGIGLADLALDYRAKDVALDPTGLVAAVADVQKWLQVAGLRVGPVMLHILPKVSC